MWTRAAGQTRWKRRNAACPSIPMTPNLSAPMPTPCNRSAHTTKPSTTCNGQLNCALPGCRRILSWRVCIWRGTKTRAPLTSTTAFYPSTRATPAACCACAWLTEKSANSPAPWASARTRWTMTRPTPPPGFSWACCTTASASFSNRGMPSPNAWKPMTASIICRAAIGWACRATTRAIARGDGRSCGSRWRWRRLPAMKRQRAISCWVCRRWKATPTALTMPPRSGDLVGRPYDETPLRGLGIPCGRGSAPPLRRIGFLRRSAVC